MSDSVTPGQASVVSLLLQTPDGQEWINRYLAPPGKDAQLPDNLATTDMLAQMLSGTHNASAPDQRGVSLFFRESDGIPVFTSADRSGNETQTPLVPVDSIGRILQRNVFTLNGTTATQPLGAAIQEKQVYLQLSDDGKGTTIGSIVLYDGSHYATFLNYDGKGTLTNQRGHTIVESASHPFLQSFVATNVQDGDRITYPQPFATASPLSDIQIILTARTPSTVGGQQTPPLLGYANPDQYGFSLVRTFVDSTPKSWTGDVSVLVLGPPA